MKCYARSYQVHFLYLCVLLFIPATILGEVNGMEPVSKPIINCELVGIDLINSYIEANIENLSSDDIKVDGLVILMKLIISNRNGDEYLIKNLPTSGRFLFGEDRIPFYEYSIMPGSINYDRYIIKPFMRDKFQFKIGRQVIIPVVGESPEVKINSGDKVHYMIKGYLLFERNSKLGTYEIERQGNITFKHSSYNQWNVVWLPISYLTAFKADYWYTRAKQTISQFIRYKILILTTGGIISIMLILICLKKYRSISTN